MSSHWPEVQVSLDLAIPLSHVSTVFFEGAKHSQLCAIQYSGYDLYYL